MTKYSDEQLRSLLDITDAISDETRIRILMMLNIAELCVCQITAATDLAPSTISKHLSILEAARLIKRRKAGRWVYYRLGDLSASKTVKDALRLVKSSVAESADIAQDKRKIRAVLEEDVNTVCRRLYHGEGPYGNFKGKKNVARIKS